MNGVPKQIELIVRERGWSVIPLGPNKKPPIKWKPFQETPAPLEQLDAWEREYRPSAWAVVTGVVSGHFVLDFDGDAGRALLEKFALDPHVKTPNGGFHVRIEHPGWLV